MNVRINDLEGNTGNKKAEMGDTIILPILQNMEGISCFELYIDHIDRTIPIPMAGKDVLLCEITSYMPVDAKKVVLKVGPVIDSDNIQLLHFESNPIKMHRAIRKETGELSEKYDNETLITMYVNDSIELGDRTIITLKKRDVISCDSTITEDFPLAGMMAAPPEEEEDECDEPFLARIVSAFKGWISRIIESNSSKKK